MDFYITIDKDFLGKCGDRSVIGSFYDQWRESVRYETCAESNPYSKDNRVVLLIPKVEGKFHAMQDFVLPSIIRDILWLQEKGIPVILEEK